MTNVTQEYTGMVLTAATPLQSTAIRVRIYLDKPAVFTLGINFVGMPSGYHAFLPPKDGSSVFRHLTAGWQIVEGVIPPSFEGTTTGALTSIIFELQQPATLNDFIIDDLRVTLQ
jgi:hypothetical protein